MTGKDRAFPPDPDAVDAALDEMVIGRPIDVTHIARIEPEVMLRNVARMKLSLSRYGRISFEWWADKDVVEMRHTFDLLVELLSKEGVAAQEDR